MSDEGFHEIQLNGKQLVFLFMSATVVAVVVFLCGVMVGRGVPQPGTAVMAAGAETPIDPTASVPRSSSVTPVTSDRPPVTTKESLTYAERLEAPIPPPETLSDAPSPPAEVPEPPPAPPVDEVARPPVGRGLQTPGPPTAPQSPALAAPQGDGWVVQVGAYPQANAEEIADSLAAKGYSAFILPRDRGLFAVRVGTFSDRREAEAMARRLEQDEQFKDPWVTR